MINISLQNPLRLLLPISFSLLLAACGGGTAVKPDKTGTETPGTAKSAPAPYTPPKRGGGYYLDDGPGDNPPPDIDSIPDAMPRVEPLLARANRPYSALGSRYTPMAEFKPYKKRGLASWYGKRYHGQKTSSGEIYDMYSMTGAHTTLPLPSYARVTNPENGRSVIVRINDRGPFHSDRLIDLSYAAAYKLRLLEKGSGMVEVEAIDPRNPTPINPAPQPAAEPATSNPAVLEPAPADTAAIAAADNAAQPLNGDFVQVGAFKYKTNAENLISKLKGQSLTENVNVESWYNAGTYRVRLGPYANRQDAERAATKIRQALGTSAVLVRK